GGVEEAVGAGAVAVEVGAVDAAHGEAGDPAVTARVAGDERVGEVGRAGDAGVHAAAEAVVGAVVRDGDVEQREDAVVENAAAAGGLVAGDGAVDHFELRPGDRVDAAAGDARLVVGDHRIDDLHPGAGQD